MRTQESDFKAYKIINRYLKVAALFAGAAILFLGCENNIEKIRAFSSPENLPVVEAYNYKTMLTDSGEVRFSIKAPKLLRFEDDGKAYIEFPEGIELIRYDNNHNIISSITADYAKQFENEDKWEAKNNVVATNAMGDTLKTEHLIWLEKEEKIFTEEFVRIIRENQIITGIGFQSDQALQNWRIKNPRGTIYIEVDSPRSNSEEPHDDDSEILPQPDRLRQPLEFPN